jgi:DNA-binding response OmpR family regulator
MSGCTGLLNGISQKEEEMKVLLIDSNPSVTRFLIINLKRSGFEAPVVSSVERAEEMSVGTEVDCVALASSDLANTKEDIARLRQAFSCPILVYGAASDREDGLSHADNYILQFHEPSDFIKAVEETIAKRVR